MEETGAAPGELAAYIGPHIAATSYEVSQELADQFSERFGQDVIPTPRHLDLSAAIRVSLCSAGVPCERVVDCGLDTYELTDRFFSHRAEHGRTGRHGALAFMRPEVCSEGLLAPSGETCTAGDGTDATGGPCGPDGSDPAAERGER